MYNTSPNIQWNVRITINGPIYLPNSMRAIKCHAFFSVSKFSKCNAILHKYVYTQCTSDLYHFFGDNNKYYECKSKHY